MMKRVCTLLFVLDLIAVVFMAGISFNEMRRGEKTKAAALGSLYSVLSPDDANAWGSLPDLQLDLVVITSCLPGDLQ